MRLGATQAISGRRQEEILPKTRMSQAASVIEELEDVLAAGSSDRRSEILRRVTDLFLGNAESFSHDQVGVFDDVLAHLIHQVETKALAELGARLAPVGNAPNGVIRTLARHDEISVAGPVLAQSPQLTDGDLVEIAGLKGQGHLGAISERKRLAAAVTDILIQRGDTTVVRKLSQNQGATFSENGYETLATRAETDEQLAENLGVRLDMPPQLLQSLMSKATETVRARLRAVVPLEDQAAIQQVLASVSDKVMRKAAAPRDFGRAVAVIDRMQEQGRLNEIAIAGFAGEGKYEEMVAGLARICVAPTELVERLMQNPRYDGVLVACKAAEFRWPTFSAILKARFTSYEMSTAELTQARADFIKLSVTTARRMFRFWLVRGVAKANS
ncbi:MAG TPA: DUF2336 domain-containing protein [Pseudolabrys sp.]|nr:DUF2336 domain-containing protein [Pseudolabrys sp.]